MLELESNLLETIIYYRNTMSDLYMYIWLFTLLPIVMDIEELKAMGSDSEDDYQEVNNNLYN